MPGEPGNKRSETELMPNHALPSEPTIAPWLQSTLLVGWVAEFGALESHAPKQDGRIADCCDQA